MRHIAVVVATVTALLAAGCSAVGPDDDGRLTVVSTVSPITNLVENVGGPHIRLTGIVPEGTNSHTFEPAPSDARVLAEADVLFMNGLHLEEPTRELAEANLPGEAPIVRLAEETIGPDDYIFDFSFPEAGGNPNPHLWTNPPYARRFAEIVKDQLSALDPEHADDYEANFEALAERIDELDRLIRRATETVPPQQRELLTYHDSFPYFAREYGWRVVGAIQPSDFSEPTPREVTRLIEQIRTSGLPAIFGSEVFPSPVLEQLAAETGVRYIDELRDDDLPGEPGDLDHTYLGLMVFDLRTIVGALGGDASVFDRLDVSNVSEGGEVSYAA